MKQLSPKRMGAVGGAVLTCILIPASAGPGTAPQPAPNPTGVALTFTRKKKIDQTNPFFQDLGTNGRTCATCHAENSGWTLTPPEVEARFIATDGLDPLFRSNDGSTSPAADISTIDGRREAFKLLRTRGLIRVGLPIPAGAEFTLDVADDPYQHASATELSLFRRPLPATNLKFQSMIMWDGRQTTPGNTLAQNLASQALDATMGHAQAGVNPSPAVLKQIVDFESGLFTAQVTDGLAGTLLTNGGKGGPKPLSTQKYKDGINNPFAPKFEAQAFKLFTGFSKKNRKIGPDQAAVRASIARGEVSFNRKPFTVTGVAGLNDVQGRPAISATCTTCHNTPNEGGSSVNALMDLGISVPERRTADVPLYTLRNLTTNATVQTTDPGRALITGKWQDLNRFKVPSMRGLAARAPYFHNGSAANLREVVEFYRDRFNIQYTEQEIEDLVAFLRSL